MYDLGDLNGPDGNSYFIMAKVVKWMKECGYSDIAIKKYLSDAKSSDYDNLVAESEKMVRRLNRRFNTNESFDCIKYLIKTDKAFRK